METYIQMMPTQRANYKGATYWVDIDKSEGSSLYRYWIDFNGKEVESEHPFESASAAGTAARAAIERWASVQASQSNTSLEKVKPRLHIAAEQ